MTAPLLPGDMPDCAACPHCGSSYLHHGTVRVFDRSEDQETVYRTTVSGLPVSVMIEAVPNRGSGNPSNRRDGITIEFDCEECGKVSLLGIAQIKGLTKIAWL